MDCCAVHLLTGSCHSGGKLNYQHCNYSFTAIENSDSSLMPCSQHFSYDFHAKAMQLISLVNSLVRTEVAQVAVATFKHLG